MSGEHVSDAQLQQYLSDHSSCDAVTIRHIEGCGVCRAALENYRLLFSELPSVHAPSFDFHVAAAVMAKLPGKAEWMPAIKEAKAEEGKVAPVRRPVYLILGMTCAVGAPLYLFKQNLLVLFTEVHLPFLFAMLGATMLILLVMLHTMNRQYRRQLEELAL